MGYARDLEFAGAEAQRIGEEADIEVAGLQDETHRLALENKELRQQIATLKEKLELAEWDAIQGSTYTPES
jgi:hypothetical protein